MATYTSHLIAFNFCSHDSCHIDFIRSSYRYFTQPCHDTGCQQAARPQLARAPVQAAVSPTRTNSTGCQCCLVDTEPCGISLFSHTIHTK